MDIANLIRMANQIAEYFAAYPDREEALEGAATHIQKFWEPRMRVALLDFLTDHEDGRDADIQLHALMRDAVTQYRARLMPVRAAQA
jgi:formate dehydrogenase subunit delta